MKIQSLALNVLILPPLILENTVSAWVTTSCDKFLVLGFTQDSEGICPLGGKDWKAERERKRENVRERERERTREWEKRDKESTGENGEKESMREGGGKEARGWYIMN